MRIVTEPQPRKSSKGKIVGVVVAALILGALFLYVPTLTREIPIFTGPIDAPTLAPTTRPSSSQTFTAPPATSPTTTTMPSDTTTTHTSKQPPTAVTSATATTLLPTPTPTERPQLQIYCSGSVLSGKNVTAPDPKLIDFSMKLINKDRATAGIPPVKLNPNLIAQEHAEDMLKNTYVSHWDISGLKPYMRYTLFCGHNSNSENAAAFFGAPVPDPYKALTDLEFQMVYNDTAQHNAHRDTILGSNYNQIQIGVAYDPENGIYFDHEFETAYINWTGTPPLSSKPGQTITLGGNFTYSELKIDSISVYYDPLPTSKTSCQLMNSPYDDGYGPGIYIGSVTQPGFFATNGVTIVANTWKQTGTSFIISFTLDKAYKVKGDGIYTLYLFVANGKSERFSTTNVSIRVTQ